MFTYYIGFDDEDKKGEEFLSYLGLYIEGGKLNKPHKESSGDFIKDWFNIIKKLNELGENGMFPIYTVSSQINHLEEYDFNYISAYLHTENNINILKYLYGTKGNWWKWEDEVAKGIEFFVPDNTWTWEQLKEYTKD